MLTSSTINSINNQLLEESRKEANEVSYTVIDISQHIIDPNSEDITENILQQIATAINVRLTSPDGQTFPYVSFDNFDSLSAFDKLFLYGPSGCGKSRGIYEIIKKNIRGVGKLYILNPRNVVDLELTRGPLIDIVVGLKENDIVIWDNFPDDLIRRDYNNVLQVLELLSSKDIRKLVVTLKPKYLEVFRNLAKNIPEYFSNEVTYSKETFKEIIKSYGNNIFQFREEYAKYILNELEEITNILWKKEPSPLTILDYYAELKTKDDKNNEKNSILYNEIGHLGLSPNGVTEAERLLRSANYYEHQFGLMASLQERRNDVEFLYILETCYQLGLDRTETSIANLQQAVFGSRSPKEPYNKLSNWLYMIGKQYCIHDVCREAIKLKDHVKIKILLHITNSFNEIIPTDPAQVNRFGLFLGRNIELLVQDYSVDFLPKSIYSYMKENALFEKAIGQGAGEVFSKINDSFRKILLNKADTEIEFGIGMAESLGFAFLSLGYNQRQLILQKIYDGLLFARFFGQSLGRYLKDLKQEIRQEILSHTDVNPQFADGIGIGLGQVYGLLDNEFRNEINTRARASVDLTRGLGCGIGFSIHALGETEINDIYAKAETNNEFDAGLGFGCAMLYSALPEDFQINVRNRCNNYIEFSYGFGVHIAYLASENCPAELLSMMEKNITLSLGLGLGFGLKFLYLPLEFQSFLLEKSKENGMLDFGLGFGIGLIYRHLPPEVQRGFFDHGNKKNEFDTGLGFGLGWSWIYLSSQDKDQAYARCRTNFAFAYGLGIGQGYHFKYISEEERDNILRKADEHAQYDTGLGFGLGESFLNLDESLQKLALSRSKTNNFFAYGLSSGLGMIFSYLSQQFQEDLFSKSFNSTWFARGLGFGIGRYSLPYFNNELQSKIFLKTKENVEFALGLGEGIGSSFAYYKEFQKETLNKFKDNQFYSRGFGIGFGKNFVYLSRYHTEIFRLAEKDIHLAIGLGEGIGSIFGYLDPFNRKDILDKTYSTDGGFAKGFATGLGINSTYLEESISEILATRSKDRQFSIGLGKGLGYIYKYISESKKETLFLKARNNIYFAIGLGEGIGSLYDYLDKEMECKIMAEADNNKGFATGLGIGMSTSYANNEEKLSKIFSITNENVLKGSSCGFGIVYPFLKVDLQQELKKLIEKSRSFAKEFGFGFGHAYTHVRHHQPIDSFDNFNQLLKSTEFAYGFGVGTGHNFSFLDTKLQEKSLSNAKEKEFGFGFGIGLAKSFRHIDLITGGEIIRQAIEEDSDFSYSLGYALGDVFPSLSDDIQKKILETEKDCWFIKGFTKGIINSSKHLDQYLQREISKFIEQNISFHGIRQENSKTISEIKDSTRMLEYDFPYYYFPLLVLTDITHSAWAYDMDEVVFSDQRKSCCVGFIDMIESTKIASRLEEIHLSKYYSIFLNAMATIIKNFGGSIIKNTGDALIFYFPNTVDLRIKSKLKEALNCGTTMVAAHGAINAKMHREELPPVNYRISMDYGVVEMAISKSSGSEDLFGSTMNICAKINRKAPPNGMIIGERLFNTLENTSDDDDGYIIESVGEITLGLAGKEKYSIYSVESKRKGMVNPFKYRFNDS